MSVTLFDHQKEALELTQGFTNIAVYHDMGLGKTFTGSEMLFRFGQRMNLVVCQKSKVQDWINHLHINYCAEAKVFDLTGNKGFTEFFLIDDLPHVGVINYELAWRRKDLANLENFTMLLDESSLIQNPKAKQTKFILKLRPNHVILLSGTPVGGKYENLWTQIHLLGWDIQEKLYQEQYVNWTLIEAGGISHRIVDMRNPYKNTQRLKDKLKEHGAVFKKTEECFNLPGQVFQTIEVKPTKEYKRFRMFGIVTVQGEELVGDTSLTKLLYSRQLCGHYNPDKLEAFRDLVESTQDRLLVFYTFNAELDELKRICKEVGRPVSEINGHTKDLRSYETESNSVTLVQYQAGSKGLNLQKCSRVIYFTLPLSSEDFEQSKKRIHRIGQENTCFYYILLCSGSVECKILKTLEQRKDYTDELFRKEEDNDQM